MRGLGTQSANNQYEIKAIDVLTSAYGFFIKVSLLDPEHQDQFNFTYIPLGRYKSIEMLDFLLGRKNESGAMIHLMEGAIRQELSAEAGFTILFSDRPDNRDGQVLEEPAWGDREQNAASGMVVDETEWALRPIADNLLQVFRQVFLSAPDNVRKLTAAGEGIAAFRIDQEKLYLSFLGNGGDRDITALATVDQALSGGMREFLHNLLVVNQPVKAGRIITRDLMTATGLDGQRLIQHSATVINEKVLALRDIISGALIQQGSAGQRQAVNDLIVNLYRPAGTRALTRSLQVLKSLTGTRVLDKITTVMNEHTAGRLAGRQYPARLLLQYVWGQRDISRSLFLHETGQGLRSISRDAQINRGLSASRIYQNNPLFVNYDFAQALRLNTRSAWRSDRLDFGTRYVERLLSLISGAQAVRVIHQDTLLLTEAGAGYRQNGKGLYLPKHMEGGLSREKKVYLMKPEELRQFSKLTKALYVQRISEAVRNLKKDMFLGDNTESGGEKAPYPSWLDEPDWVGFKEAFGSDLLTGTASILETNRRGIVNEERIEASIYRALHAEITELDLWAKVIRELPAYILDVVIATKYFYADIMDDLLAAIRSHPPESLLEMLVDFGIQTPRIAHLEPNFLTAVRDRLLAVIDSGLPFGTKAPDSGILLIDLDGAKEPKPSDLIQGTVGNQEPKPSVIEQEVLGDEEFRPSIIQVENPFGYFEAQPSFISEGDQEAFKPKDHKATIGSEQVGFQEPKPSTVNESLQMDRTLKDSTIGESELADLNHRPAQIDSMLLSQLQQRMSALSTGFIFAEKPVDRASYLSDLYMLGEAGIRDGLLPEDNLMKLAQLVIQEGIVGEDMFAVIPQRASDLLEHILGSMEMLRAGTLTDPMEVGDREHNGAAWIPEEAYAEKELKPASEIKLDVASKKEHYADLISEITGDKELGQAIILDYLVAQEKIKEGIYPPEALFGKEELKQALIQESSAAQSFIYDYSNDVLTDGMDPAEWTGGYAVPEDYDPHDPFNAYYPWTLDKGPLAMAQSDWARFDEDPAHPGTWTLDTDKAQFTCVSESPKATGYFYNDFSHSDYQFETDFKVDDNVVDNGTGIVFRFKDDKNYHIFMISGGDADHSLGMSQPMQLFKVVNGQHISMGMPMNAFTWTKGQWNRVKIYTVGSRIKIWVNNRMQYDLTD